MRNNKTNTLMDLLLMEEDPMLIYGIRKDIHLLYFLEDIEKTVRTSRMYRSWVFLKKAKHKQTICKALNIDTEDYEGIHIEQDHFPISLYDICLIIGLKMLSELKKGEYLTILDIASEVLKEHLSKENYIGSISLSTTHHQMRHEGIQPVDIDDINGNYQDFIEKYKQFIPEAVQERINYNLNRDK